MSNRSKQIDMLFRQGQFLHKVGRLAEAEQVYRQILTVEPGYADAMHGLGILALQAGQAHVAINYLDQAIASRPSSTVYHLHRANALLALGRYDDAIATCRTVLRSRRHNPAAYQVLGHALSDSGHHDDALEAYRNAFRQDPRLPDIVNNLGTALRNLQRLEEAESRLREARRLTPDDIGVLTNLSSVLKELGRIDEAEACLSEGLRRQHNNPVLLYNMGLLKLLRGDFAGGWAGFEYRFASGAVPGRGLSKPQWRGEPLENRTVLIHAEQGLGDTLQFSRFVPTISGQVLFEVPRRLVRLLSGLPDLPRLIAAGDQLPEFDLVCPLMSVPGRLGVSIYSSPDTVPYLKAEPALVRHWSSRLGTQGFKVGIAWQGNPNRLEDIGRSVHLREFEPLTRIPGVRLISLQKDYGTDQLQDVPDIESFPDEFDTGEDAFVDTAAIMACLDLVISTDTAIAHLAGALGRPVWVPLRMVPDWRWMLERTDSPWYQTMLLFRQCRRGDWESVFSEMAAQLNVASRSQTNR